MDNPEVTRELLNIKRDVKELKRMMREYYEDQRPSQRISAEQAAHMLGMNITKSGHHRRRLTELYREGIIKKRYGRRPYTYDRQEISVLTESISI